MVWGASRSPFYLAARYISFPWRLRWVVLGWLAGLEPVTPGVTVQCSTIELQPPYRSDRGRRIYTINQDHATPMGVGRPPAGPAVDPPAGFTQNSLPA